MRFDVMLGGFLLLALFVLGGSFMIADMNANYGSEGVNMSDDKFQGVYDKVDEVYGITSDAKDKTLNADIENTDSWESMTKGSYSAVRLVSGSVPLFTNITNTIAAEVGVPPFIVIIAYTAFLLVIIFNIIYMIFRYEP